MCFNETMKIGRDQLKLDERPVVGGMLAVLRQLWRRNRIVNRHVSHWTRKIGNTMIVLTRLFPLPRTRPFSYLGICVALFFTFFASNAYPENLTNAPGDLLIFFKQAINSPPDIEKYVVKRTNLLLPANVKQPGSTSFEYLEGALSGTNFFLQFLPDPDLPADTNALNNISVRSGSSTFEIGGHGIIYGTGENGLTEDVKAQYQLSRQILSMGTEEIELGTVKWSGNDFTAKNILGKDVHGSLLVSNNLPFRMELSLADKSFPYGAVEYTYATPEGSFAGYPSKFVKSINNDNGDGLKPLAEIKFKSVLLATQNLDAAFFSEDRFADRIRYTNVFSNSDYYVSKTKSKQLVMANSLGQTGGITNRNSRAVIYSVLIFVTLLPLAILLTWSVRKTKHQTK